MSARCRFELVGVDVGNRWADIGEYLKTSINERVQPFLSTKYLYSLALARGEGETTMRRLDPVLPLLAEIGQEQTFRRF